MEKKRSIAVIDLKAFYAYVECIDRGLDPWKAPLIVADKERGKNTIILSVSPYLKSKGVPSRLRVKELPAGFNYIYATPRMERYIERSGEVISTMLEFVSETDMHVYSIDEAFIDLTSYLSYYKKSAYELVKMIMDRIRDKTGLQATAGIGDNFFLSKVALDIYAKHEKDGIAVMHIEDVPTKLWPITPLRKIWGIGMGFETRLNRLGITTVEELAKCSKAYLIKEFGIMGEQLYNHANGIDESDIHEIYIPKETSITIGQTLMRDYKASEMPLIIREMSEDLSAQLRSRGELTSVVSLMIGYSSNQGGFSHQMSLEVPTDRNDILSEALLTIFRKNIKDLPIRNISLNYGKLIKDIGKEQLNIFEDAEDSMKERALELMIDEIHNKYGKDIVVRASSLTESGVIITRHSQIGGHRK